MTKALRTKENILPVTGLICVFAYFIAAFFLRVDSSFFVGSDDIAKGLYSRAYIHAFVSGASSSLSWRWHGFYMYFPYVGQVPQYFAAVFLFLFSGSLGPLLAFRLTSVFFGTGILLCVFFVLKNLCSWATAFWAVFFLGTNSMFIQAVRHGFWREEVFQIFGLWLGVLCLVKGFKSNKNWMLGAGMFVFGLTLWAKMMFPGYIIGAVAGGAVLSMSGYSLRRHMSFFTSSKVLLGAAAFLAGCFPLLIYNLFIARNDTSKAMLAPVMKYQVTGVTERISWFFGNVLTRFNDVFHYTTTMLFRDDYGLHWFACVFIWCAAFWCLGLVFFVPVSRARRRFLIFIFTAYGVLIFLTAFIVKHYSPEHIIIIVPFFEILCGVAVADVFERIKKPFVVFVLSVLIISGWGWGHVRYEHERYLSRNSRRGYLWKDFLVRDMEIILADFSQKNVLNLFCIYDFGGPLEFFKPGLNIVECHNSENVGQVCTVDALEKDSWFILTNDPDNNKIKLPGGYFAVLESEYVSRAGKYEKLYLFAAEKDAQI